MRGGEVKRAAGHEVVILGRRPAPGSGIVEWDGVTVGPWAGEIDGCDVVLDLAGRSVDCRYTKTNLAQMFGSRVDAARAVGWSIERAARPPAVWLQVSTATIYAHRFDADNDEAGGAAAATSPTRPRTGASASRSPWRGSAPSVTRTRPKRARSPCVRRWS